jgi:hypothetical protein
MTLSIRPPRWVHRPQPTHQLQQLHRTIEVIHTRVYRESNETTFLRALTSGFSDLPEENTDDEIEISEGLLLILFYFLL